MPRKATWPPVPKPHASGRSRVLWKGRDHYLPPIGHPDHQREYAALLARLLAGEEAPATPRGGTVRACVIAWLKGPGASMEAKERDHYDHALDALRRECGGLPAERFDAGALERVCGRMVRALGWSRQHARHQAARIKAAWRWLERHGHVPKGSWANLRTLPGLGEHERAARDAPRVTACGWPELARVCRRARAEVRAMLLLGWFSGMRPGEVCRMTPGEVDTSGEEWIYRPGKHKNSHRGQARAVVLGPTCRKILAPWLEGLRPDEYVFKPQRRRGRVREHYTPQTFAQAVRRAAERAGVEGFHAYRNRHAAKDRVTREQGLDAARSFLGQKSLFTTNDYGDALDLELARRAARRLG